VTATSTETEDFTAVLTLPASPEAIASLFSSPAGVSRWWGRTEGDAGVGGTLITHFGNYGVNCMRVLEVGPSRVVWESIAAERGRGTSHQQEWLGTTMEFDIAPAGAGTELRFRHAGLTPQLECWNDCFAGWTQSLASIQTFAETGTGNPFPT
jgi:uncharacterized protein YndB with AHSA1/START domain